jgi:hypothetical protein
MSDEHKEEKSWAAGLAEEYRQMILDFQSQQILVELERIDEFVEFLEEENLPHAEEIIKRILYNVKREEKREQRKNS